MNECEIIYKEDKKKETTINILIPPFYTSNKLLPVGPCWSNCVFSGYVNLDISNRKSNFIKIKEIKYLSFLFMFLVGVIVYFVDV